MTELSNRAVLVTGAASGIGAAVVALLSERGARAAGLDLEPLRHKEESGSARRNVVSLQADVADEQAVGCAVAEAERALGPLSGVVCAAGVMVQGELLSPALDANAFRRALEVNLLGVWHVLRAVAPGMVSRRAGSIVTVASNAATTPRMGLGAYASSKAAVSMLTRCLGLELASHGVRCNVVSPGSTETPMLRALVPDGLERAVTGDARAFRLGIPLGRVASPRDVAETVVFLLSDRARHVTLQNLTVDGGATL